jgi:hypothetical protein
VEPEGQRGVCKSEKCRAPIWWRPHPTTGKMHCFNADGSSHWGTCPDTAAFRKPKQPKPSNMLDDKTS